MIPLYMPKIYWYSFYWKRLWLSQEVSRHLISFSYHYSYHSISADSFYRYVVFMERDFIYFLFKPWKKMVANREENKYNVRSVHSTKPHSNVCQWLLTISKVQHIFTVRTKSIYIYNWEVSVCLFIGFDQTISCREFELGYPITCQ